MSTKGVLQDALAIGAVWGLVEVAFSFIIGRAPWTDVTEVFMAPVAVSLVYHLSLLIASRMRRHRLLDALILGGLAVPPALYLVGSRGRAPWMILSAGLIPIVLLLVLAARQFRAPRKEGWLTSSRIASLAVCYAGAALLFAVHSTRPGTPRPSLLWIMAAWIGLAAAVSALAIRIAPRFAGPGVFLVLTLFSAGLAFQHRSAPPTHVPTPQAALSPPSRPDAPNILLIVLDTVRADHLDLYGYARPTLPQTGRYLREGLVFDRATASGTFSFTSHGSLFSGLLPSQHGAHSGRSRGRRGSLWPDIITLADELKERGYRTEGVSANDIFLREWTGFHKGFDSFQTSSVRSPRYRSLAARIATRLRILGVRARRSEDSTWPARDISNAGIAIAAQTQSPFFLFLNYFDAHGPHEITGAPAWIDSAESDVVNAYDSEIAYIDTEVARLLSSLEAQGLLEKTLVILTADHGEYFNERGLRGHPPVPYEGSIHIPLALRLAGVVPEGRSERRTGLHEIYRIVLDVVDQRPLDWLSRPDPTPRILSEAWSRTDDGKVAPDDGRPSATVVFAGNLKLIHRLSGRSELFDLDQDPGEERNLFDTEVPHIVDLRTRMIQAVEDRVTRAPGPAAPPSEEVQERLRALGYAR